MSCCLLWALFPLYTATELGAGGFPPALPLWVLAPGWVLRSWVSCSEWEGLPQGPGHWALVAQGS